MKLTDGAAGGIRRILVPLDGSALAEDALLHAAAVGRGLGASLVLLRVVESAAGVPAPVMSRMDWRLQKVEARSYLGDVAARLTGRDGPAAVAEVAEGSAADEIVDRARSGEIDLVVMTTHGLGRATSFPAGGTAQKVLSSIPCSVMLVPPRESRAPGREPVAYRSVLVPVDGSPPGEWALCLAAAIAREHGAELVMLQAIPEEAPEMWTRVPISPEERELVHRLRDLRESRGREYVLRLESRLAASGVDVRILAPPTRQVEAAIHQAVEKESVDLIVTSARGAGCDDGQYARVAEHLLTGSTVPVLVLQDLAAASQPCAAGRAASA